MMSNSRSAILDWKSITHCLNLGRETKSTPPDVSTKSSATRRSIALGVCGCCHTSRQKFSTAATAFPLDIRATPDLPPFLELRGHGARDVGGADALQGEAVAHTPVDDPPELLGQRDPRVARCERRQLREPLGDV